MNLIELNQQVRKWATDKGLHKAESSKQFLKVTEEVGEVAAALARNDMHELKDGIGDVVVTLIILAMQNGMTLEECLQQAYKEIAGRKGRMVNGVFIKESDLEQNELGEYIKRKRMQKQLTLGQLSKMIGYSEAYISMVENGKRKNPSYEFLYDFAKGLNIDYMKLMYLAGRARAELGK